MAETYEDLMAAFKNRQPILLVHGKKENPQGSPRQKIAVEDVLECENDIVCVNAVGEEDEQAFTQHIISAYARRMAFPILLTGSEVLSYQGILTAANQGKLASKLNSVGTCFSGGSILSGKEIVELEPLEATALSFS